MKTRITFIIPVYKIKEEYLIQCAKSLKSQSNRNWKAIFIDDGSPDNCGQVCDSIAQGDSRIKVVHKKNQGVSVARNIGIEMADTEWVAFIDPDDWIESSAIEVINNYICNNEDYDIFCFDYWREFNSRSMAENLGECSGACSGEILNKVQRGVFYKTTAYRTGAVYEIATIWNKVYRKSFLNKNKIRFIPEAQKGQDRLFNADALLSTDKIYYIHANLYHYRCYDDSITNRYNEKIVDLTLIELDELSRQIKRHGVETKYRTDLDCRICTRLYSCMRLYYFNKKNPNSKVKRIKQVRQLSEKEPFKSALWNVDMKMLSMQEKIFVWCIKHGIFVICEILVKLKDAGLARKL